MGRSFELLQTASVTENKRKNSCECGSYGYLYIIVLRIMNDISNIAPLSFLRSTKTQTEINPLIIISTFMNSLLILNNFR